MSFVTQAKTKRLLSVHGWAGTILGILVYVCIFTGSIVVFEDEIDTWSQGIVEHHETLGSNVDAHFRRHASSVDKAYQEEVSIFRISEGDIRYVFHTHEKHPETGELVDAGVQITIDPETGNVLERHEGILEEFPDPPGDALRDFWVDLHVSLYMPNPYGLILVGILGLMMMAASISGILIHKHVFRDAFIGVRDRSRLVGARDFHVLAGTWGLPFALILAFTGAFFGFAGELGIPLLAFVAFDGDQLAMVETILGHQEGADLSAAPLTNLDAIMADAAARAGSVVEFVNILHYGTASAKVSVFFVPSDGALSNTVLGYNGVTGAFTGEMPAFGQVPSVGSTLISIIAPLHFGNFAGFASKIVWLIMGIAMTYVAASGLLLWTKRREGEPLWDKFNHFISVVIWGLPFAMLVSAATFFVTLPFADPHFWTPVGFLVGVFAAFALAFKREITRISLQVASGALCMTLPFLRQITGGTDWWQALIGGGVEILVIDALLIVAGLMLLRGPATSAFRPNQSAPIQEPGE